MSKKMWLLIVSVSLFAFSLFGTIALKNAFALLYGAPLYRPKYKK